MDKNSLVYPPVIDGVQDKQFVEIIRAAGFKRFTKSLMSDCRHPERTAIRLQPAAVDAIYQELGMSPPDAPEPRRKRENDGHRFTYRAGCRLSDDEGRELELYLKHDPHYRNKTELTKALLQGYIRRKRKQYSDRPAAPDQIKIKDEGKKT
jgi:hypothetical protein